MKLPSITSACKFSKKNPISGPYFSISNAVVQKYGLSLEAIGLYCEIASRPNDWCFHKSVMMKRFRLGRYKFNRIIKELKAHRLLTIEKYRDPQTQQIGYSWTLYLEPYGEEATHAENAQLALCNGDVRLGDHAVHEPSADFQTTANLEPSVDFQTTATNSELYTDQKQAECFDSHGYSDELSTGEPCANFQTTANLEPCVDFQTTADFNADDMEDTDFKGVCHCMAPVEPWVSFPTTAHSPLQNKDIQIKQKQEKQEKEPKDLVDFDCLEKHTTQAIEMFNRIMGTNGLGDDKLSRTRVMDRLREGYSVDDVVSVIKHKTAEWQSSPKMANFLRLPTLCSPKHFDDYLQAAKQSTPAEAHSMPAPKDHAKQKIRLIQSQINAAKGYVARLKSFCNQKIHGGAIDSQERQIVRWEAEIGQLLAV